MITEFGCPNCGSSDYKSQGEWDWINGNSAEQLCVCKNCNQHFVIVIGPVETKSLTIRGVQVQHAKEDIIYDGKTREQLIESIADVEFDGLDIHDLRSMIANSYIIWPNEEIISRYRAMCGSENDD